MSLSKSNLHVFPERSGHGQYPLERKPNIGPLPRSFSMQYSTVDFASRRG